MSQPEYFCERCGAKVEQVRVEPKPQSNAAFLVGVLAVAVVVAALSALPEWLAWSVIAVIIGVGWRWKRGERRFECAQCRIELPLDMVRKHKPGNAV